MSEKRGFWMPAEIWDDDRLTTMEKCLLAQIYNLDNEDGCYASNTYLAQSCKCKENKVSKAIGKFRKLGLIEKLSFNGRNRIIKTCCVSQCTDEQGRVGQPDKADLYKQPMQTCTGEQGSVGQTDKADLYKQPIPPINKKDNNKANKKAECKRFAPPTLEEVRAYCRERNNRVDAQRFIDYYTSNGWKVGRNPMKDWKAAVRTWERNDGGAQSTSQSSGEVVYRDIYEIAREKFGRS